MSFLKSLFGGGGPKSPPAARPVRELEYNGFLIEAIPYAEAGQFQVAGLISKTIDGVPKEYRFVRADRFATLEDAADFAIMKGRQIVDLQGDRIFTQP